MSSTTSAVTASNSQELAEKLKAMAPLPKKDKEAADYIDSAISKLIVFAPVYGTVFMFLNKRQDYGVPTMGVGVIDRVNIALYYNPEFVKKLTVKELRAVLIHEALHFLLHHITRSAHYNYQPIGYNAAADMAINCHIANLPPKALYPKNFGLEDFQASEYYYEQLKQQAEQNAGKEGGLCSAGGIPFYIKGKGEFVGDHSRWGECEEGVVKEKIRSVAETAIKEQEKRGWSEIGTNVAKAIIEANTPQINWKREFRYFIEQMVMFGRRKTRTRLNRREHSVREQIKSRYPDSIWSQVYLQPGTKRDYTSKLLVAIDTSGSMSDQEIEICLTEVNGMTQHVECHLMFFDTQLQGEPIHISKRIRNMEITGRGGTCFQPVMDYVQEHKYDGVIIMTDGFAPFPQKPRARVLWAVTLQGKAVEFPYGKRVLLDIKPK